jgi:hypothetical protein
LIRVVPKLIQNISQKSGKPKADFQYTIVGEAKQKRVYRSGETLFTCDANHVSAASSTMQVKVLEKFEPFQTPSESKRWLEKFEAEIPI